MNKFKYIGEGKFTFKGNEYAQGEIIETDRGILPVNLFTETSEPKLHEIVEKVITKKGGK